MFELIDNNPKNFECPHWHNIIMIYWENMRGGRVTHRWSLQPSLQWRAIYSSSNGYLTLVTFALMKDTMCTCVCVCMCVCAHLCACMHSNMSVCTKVQLATLDLINILYIELCYPIMNSTHFHSWTMMYTVSLWHARIIILIYQHTCKKKLPS